MEVENLENETENVSENKGTNSMANIRSSVVMSIKQMLPKPCNGKTIYKRIKKLGLSMSDFAFLLNRSAGGLYNLSCPGHARYKKGKENEDIMLEIAVTYLEKIFEEKKQKAKEEKQKEKERVLKTINGTEVMATTLSLRECNTLENKTNIMNAIHNLAKQGVEKISYSQVAEVTGLTPQQIAKIRERDSDVDDWFTYTNEVEFDEMQSKLSEIVNCTKDVKPSVAIKAMETKMKYMKSNQKDKISDMQNESKNIWDKFRDMKDVSAKNEILIVDSYAEEK